MIPIDETYYNRNMYVYFKIICNNIETVSHLFRIRYWSNEKNIAISPDAYANGVLNQENRYSFTIGTKEFIEENQISHIRFDMYFSYNGLDQSAVIPYEDYVEYQNIMISLDEKVNTYINPIHLIFKENQLNEIINNNEVKIKNIENKIAEEEYIKTNYYQDINLLKYKKLFSGISLDVGTGEEKYSTAMRITSDFIDVENTEILIATSNSNIWFVHFYDKNFNHISSQQSGYINYMMANSEKFKREVIQLEPNLNIKYIRFITHEVNDGNQLISKKLNDDSLFFSRSIIDGTYDKINYSAQRITTNPIKINSTMKSVKINITNPENYKFAYYVYRDDGTFLKRYWYTTEQVYTFNKDDRLLYLSLSKSDNAVIEESEVDSMAEILIVNYEYNAIEEIDYALLQKYEDISDNIDFEYGTLNPSNGSTGSSLTRIRSDFIPVGKGTIIELNDYARFKNLVYYYNIKSKRYIQDLPWTTNKITIEYDAYIKILLCKINNGSITDEEKQEMESSLKVYRAFPQYLIDSLNSSEQNSVPDYFLPQLKQAVLDIHLNQFNSGFSSDNFIFITDLHWQSNDRNSPNLIKYILNNTNITKIFCGGDLIGGGEKNTNIELMLSCINAFKNVGEFYIAFGNHDSNTIGTSDENKFSSSQVYALMHNYMDKYKNINYGPEPLYYYFDNNIAKTRYIIINTGTEGSAFSNTQKEWIVSNLNQCPNNYHIMIFLHIAYATSTTWHVGLTADEIRISGNMSWLSGIIDEFNNSSTNNSKVEAVFSGHSHIDADFKTAGGVPIILTDTDSQQTFSTDEEGNKLYTAGTITEQAFDCVTIDYSNKVINLTRIGRGENRIIKY